MHLNDFGGMLGKYAQKFSEKLGNTVFDEKIVSSA